MDETEIKTDKLISFVAEKFEYGELNNSSLVQLIELAGNYLNLMTISDYANKHDMSYNGVKNCRQTIELFGVKLVIDNE
jgi:hypothetical protein